MPKVAVVAASLDILGGQGVQAFALGQGLRAEGHTVAFLPVNPRFPRGLRWVRRWPYLRTLVNAALFLPSLRVLRGAEVVHVFSASYWSFLLGPAPALLAAKAFGKHTLLNYHSGEAEDHLARWGALVHPFLRIADKIVVPSEFLRSVFARYGYRTRVIPNVVNAPRFPYRERRTLRPLLLSTRNLEPHYRVDDTIRALGLLRTRYPQATLVIAGYGSEREALERLARRQGGGVLFRGRVEPADMPALYEGADIFLNASVVDNQPVSVLEAFAAGLPVVSTATGGLVAMVRDGQTGLVVPPRDPAAMARAVARLLEDPEGAAAMARRARAEVQAYSWESVSRLWTDTYREVAA